MTAYQVYEQSVKPLSVAEKLTLARLIMDEVIPELVRQVEVTKMTAPEVKTDNNPSSPRPPRQFGAGRHLLSGAGIDVDELMATPIEDMFAEYMPEEK